MAMRTDYCVPHIPYIRTPRMNVTFTFVQIQLNVEGTYVLLMRSVDGVCPSRIHSPELTGLTEQTSDIENKWSEYCKL